MWLSLAGGVLRTHLADSKWPGHPPLVRREVKPGDASGVDALHAYCPPRQDREEADIEIAERLVNSPSLYAEILLGRIDTAERLQQVTGGVKL